VNGKSYDDDSGSKRISARVFFEKFLRRPIFKSPASLKTGEAVYLCVFSGQSAQ